MIIGTAHHVAFALHLWALAVACVGVERIVLFAYRRYALSSQALATPTLIVGAGAVGARLAMRLFADPAYGLRPAGFLDTDPCRDPIMRGRRWYRSWGVRTISQRRSLIPGRAT